MKRLLLALIITIPHLWTLPACETSAESVCDETTMDAVNVNFRATVDAHYTNGAPVDGMTVRITIYKLPCGEDRKGIFYFNGTLAQGVFETGIVNYNIHNKNDAIVAHLAIDNGANSISVYKQINGEDLQNADGQTRLINFDVNDVVE